MPEELVKKIRLGVSKAVTEAKFMEHMNSAGAPIDYRDAPAFNLLLNKDAERINAAIKQIGKVD
jgi:tripartite-type tricarboxylate transporter receptor subunit TctC